MRHVSLFYFFLSLSIGIVSLSLIAFLYMKLRKYVPSDPKVRPFHEIPEGASTGIHEAELFEQYNISPREQDIVRLIIQGYSNMQIAENLSITVSTVKKHITRVYQKMELKSRYELIALFKNIDVALER